MKPHKMKAYPSFAAFQADQAAPIRSILRALRAFVKAEAPSLTEGVKWGNGVWLAGEEPVAFAHVEPDHVQFGFFMGAKLDDPGGILEGRAQYVRHVKLRAPRELDRDALADLLGQAVALRRG